MHKSRLGLVIISAIHAGRLMSNRRAFFLNPPRISSLFVVDETRFTNHETRIMQGCVNGL